MTTWGASKIYAASTSTGVIGVCATGPRWRFCGAPVALRITAKRASPHQIAERSTMTEDKQTSPDEPTVAPPAEAPRVGRRHRRWPWIVAAVVLSPIAVVALWTVIALAYTYSHGDRAGYVQKFSRKGWICKTWEGELAMVNIPGTTPQMWDFTVRNDSVAQVISHSMGQRVSLTYDQHGGVPTSCFGDTQYFVTGVHVLGP